jgi:hypothetical protein
MQGLLVAQVLRADVRQHGRAMALVPHRQSAGVADVQSVAEG